MGGLQGVLGVVGTVITTVFSKELATGIQNAVYNFKVFTGQAQQEADAMAVQWKKAADEMAINLSSTSVDAETTVLKDQIDFTLKLRQSSDELTEANKRQLLSLNEITKEYANAYIEARKLQEVAENNKSNSIANARSTASENVSGVDNKRNVRKDVSQALSQDSFKQQIEIFNNIKNQQLMLSKLAEDTKLVQNFEAYADVLENTVKPELKDILEYDTSLNSVFESQIKILQDSTTTDEQKAEALKKLSEAFIDVSEDTTTLTEYLQDSAVQAARDLAKEYGITGEGLKQLEEDFKNAAIASVELINAENTANNAQDNYNKRLKEAEQEFEQLKGKAENYATTIVSVSRGLSQLITAFSSFKSMFDILNNQDLT
jgi:hypothetical protein